jgi:aryl-phospho-beta-D-glucosidase BglC (GH1 family)
MLKMKKMVFCALLFSASLSAMTTQGDKILNSGGEEIALKGVNWFGFNNGATMVDGLWSPGGLSSDFATIVYRMQLLGFNAVRLPISFKDLYNLAPRNLVFEYAIPSISQIQASVTNPSVSVASSQTIPPMLSPVVRTAGKTNEYLPNDSTLNRFLWTVNFFAKNGFYVLIGNHLREDQTVLEDRAKWVSQWKDLVTKISQDPVSKNRVMIDIINEPDEKGIRWDTLTELYVAVMDAVYPINSGVLFFVEGTGQSDMGANWGDGFATNTSVNSAKPFFDALITKPYLNQVVISPHVYPPSVSGSRSNDEGATLYKRLNDSFGYLIEPGYCVGSCKKFPVAIGEFGSRFTTEDVQFMEDFALYLNDHAIKNWFYWSWNPNSADTGGLVEDNWTTLIWKKIDYLTTIGLNPWYTKK